MNIHFTDKQLFDNLINATLYKIKIGSYMYGTNNDKSDTDYLYIYATSENELLSPIQTQQQLQYKDNNIDYNFTSIHNFIKNCISGDSTINFECIQSDEFNNTSLEWINKYKDTFKTYTIIRSYLGFARRDIKHYFKYNDTYNKEKRLKHIIRGYIYTYNLINHTFNFKQCNKELINTIKYIDVSNNKQLKHYESLISNLREELTEKFNNHTLNLSQKIDVEQGIKLTNDLITFCNSTYYKDKQLYLTNFDLTMFINSFENWVEY